MTTRGILFDYGGTLVHDPPGGTNSILERVLKESSVPYNASRLRDASQIYEEAWKERYAEAPRGERWSEAVKMQCLAVVFAELQVPDQFRMHLRHVANRFLMESRSVVDPQALTVLTELNSKGYRLGVLSQHLYTSEQLEEEIRTLGFLAPLSVVLTSESLGVDKPDPEIYRRATLRMNLPTEHLCMVGNSLDNDVKPAREVGMRAILLDPEERALPASGLETVRSLEALLRAF